MKPLGGSQVPVRKASAVLPGLLRDGELHPRAQAGKKSSLLELDSDPVICDLPALCLAIKVGSLPRPVAAPSVPPTHVLPSAVWDNPQGSLWSNFPTRPTGLSLNIL